MQFVIGNYGGAEGTRRVFGVEEIIVGRSVFLEENSSKQIKSTETHIGFIMPNMRS